LLVSKSNIGYFRFFYAPFASFDVGNPSDLVSACEKCIVPATTSEKTSSSLKDSFKSLFTLKSYSYDSTMLTEEDVYASKGSKARLLSVDKPLYLPSNTLLTISVTAYDVIHS
jgi:heme/copper-type cytochrome/quinol oxidase subunit 2